jgi:lipase ATG15
LSFTFVFTLALEEDFTEPTYAVEFQKLHIFHHGINEKFGTFAHLPIRNAPITHKIHMIKKIRDKEGEGVDEYVLAPNPADKTTILNLADMSWNAYENRNTTGDWRPIPGYNHTLEFGWYDDGLQGHVFGTPDRSILVIAFKGTTFQFFGDGGTAPNDQFNDNLMFSCCCAKVSDSWDPVCGCHTGGKTCNASCLFQASKAPNTYFAAAENIYRQVRLIYPNSEVWLTGHSLGGSLASLVGVNNNCPAFAYEAPGELLFGLRLGISIDLSNMQRYSVYHYGNDADPIFLGTCQGTFSTCSLFGYAMETKCKIGQIRIYDGGLVTNINNHRLDVVISRFLIPDPVPPATYQNNCYDCTNWSFN